MVISTPDGRLSFLSSSTVWAVGSMMSMRRLWVRDLKLLDGLLVDVRGAVDGQLHNAGGQRNRAGNAGAGALGGFDDFERGLVDDAIVVALEFDANALAFHGGIKNEG
jgi:hypothetical protein